MNNDGLAGGRYKPLVVDEAIPTRCECCEPSRQIVSTRTGPSTNIHYCPTTRAAYLPKRVHDGHRILIRGFYRGETE